MQGQQSDPKPCVSRDTTRSLEVLWPVSSHPKSAPGGPGVRSIRARLAPSPRWPHHPPLAHPAAAAWSPGSSRIPSLALCLCCLKPLPHVSATSGTQLAPQSRGSAVPSVSRCPIDKPGGDGDTGRPGRLIPTREHGPKGRGDGGTHWTQDSGARRLGFKPCLCH